MYVIYGLHCEYPCHDIDVSQRLQLYFADPEGAIDESEDDADSDTIPRIRFGNRWTARKAHKHINRHLIRDRIDKKAGRLVRGRDPIRMKFYQQAAAEIWDELEAEKKQELVQRATTWNLTGPPEEIKHMYVDLLYCFLC